MHYEHKNLYLKSYTVEIDYFYFIKFYEGVHMHLRIYFNEVKISVLI